MSPEQMLQQLSLAMNLPGLAFDANGCARLMVDGKVAVNFEIDAPNQCVQVYTTLAPLPLQDREATFLALLEGNLFTAQTMGATLAVDSAYHEIILCRSVAMEHTQAQAVPEIIERFVAAAEEWTRRLNTGAAQPTAAPAQALEPRLQPFFLRV